ncbi:hypothetical protein HOF40_00420 [Candidatus Parcubacteria bacterium]|jgi:hypothetical protein|nr:hypothetical protein [Candidatus Parcubacteria bacterium]MBT3948534.1 hypothetical protein [Candidatus Parcubacteria bacterium]
MNHNRERERLEGVRESLSKFIQSLNPREYKMLVECTISEDETIQDWVNKKMKLRDSEFGIQDIYFLVQSTEEIQDQFGISEKDIKTLLKNAIKI